MKPLMHIPLSLMAVLTLSFAIATIAAAQTPPAGSPSSPDANKPSTMSQSAKADKPGADAAFVKEIGRAHV